MKIGIICAAVALATLGMSSAIAQETLENKGVITAAVDMKAKQLTLKIAGKDDRTYVNKEYPMKCTIAIASGGTLEKTEVKKADFVYEDVKGKDGKAKSATLKVGADKAVSGECKLVLCTDSACSSPFTMKFKSG